MGASALAPPLPPERRRRGRRRRRLLKEAEPSAFACCSPEGFWARFSWDLFSLPRSAPARRSAAAFFSAVKSPLALTGMRSTFTSSRLESRPLASRSEDSFPDVSRLEAVSLPRPRLPRLRRRPRLRFSSAFSSGGTGSRGCSTKSNAPEKNSSRSGSGRTKRAGRSAGTSMPSRLPLPLRRICSSQPL